MKAHRKKTARNQSDGTCKPRGAKVAGRHQKLEKAREDSPPELSETA